MVKVSETTNSNLGNIEIAPEILIVIASIATSEVQGIRGHFKEIQNSRIEEISKKQLNKGVKIETKSDGIKIDIYCPISYNVNISETAREIQETVFNSIVNMTKIQPSQINVHITNIEHTS